MHVLRTSSHGGARVDVALFGCGLIGSSILESLEVNADASAVTRAFSWTDAQLQDDALTALECDSTWGRDVDEIHIVWSAGKCGFGATRDETVGELETFDRVIGSAERLSDRARVVVHCISSAGGLFEGVGHVHAGTTPSPRRPYGELKLAQEERLQRATDLRARIYRPASVVGPISRAHRMGLVPTIVLNGLRGAVTSIVGDVSTLRDYVWCGDIGWHVAGMVRDAGEEAERTTVLATGRTHAIFEVLRIVEAQLRRRLLVSYLRPTNRADIAFAPDVLPQRSWLTRDLRECVRRIHDLWRVGGALVARES